ncbi:uncharacterized protein K452DRAFT_303107 [Aplosporella prunicola CBS 121167]|uniref:D-3-phosphoglycerate dehydrogenase n=1 Tax=Aplosporella prunicola CBS 121167 TaxID=1176127 RepID=A0A6A6AVG0_9PEZI|nr:uncharacterized protein K452DRAFT_303107 [Aplosporella prunicola CBS 121167]KAF2136022.1 hypothetical protein K452DRAFT_303107 [Aplosporella prunicola CBS 121167]
MPIPVSPDTSTPTPPRAKILVPEKLSPDGLALLRETCDVDERKGLSAQELGEIIAAYDALIVRSETQVTGELLAKARNLKVVARAGVGVDNVDVEAATRLGVVVVNSPVGNVNAAAEHTVALMLAVARNIGDATQSLKSGKWERSRLVGVEVKGKTLAIVGAGKVGLTVARVASGMGMKVIAYDPYANTQLAAAASITLQPSLSALLTAADFLTIHTPLIASTKGMIGAAELRAMKPSARILNVARGGMIDEAALADALDAHALAGAAIDVFSTEPPAPNSPAARLVAHPRVLATPHLGASTVEAQETVSLDVCQQVLSILAGELPRSAVNAPLILPDEYRALQPFVSLVEKMGALYTQHYSRGRAGVRSTFDLVYEGHLAEMGTTKPLFAALIKGLLAPISGADAPAVNIVNAELVASERGILVNEQRRRESGGERGYASCVTLRARPAREPSRSRGRGGAGELRQSGGAVGGVGGAVGVSGVGGGMGGVAAKEEDQVIQGFVSADTPYISRLDRFVANFVPEGTLLICRNFDSCGKIGFVGSRLGRAGVNISSMIVAPLVDAGGEAALVPQGVGRAEGNGGSSVGVSEGSGVGGSGVGGSGAAKEAETDADGGPVRNVRRQNESLMILGVDRAVGADVVAGLIAPEGVLEASVVVL